MHPARRSVLTAVLVATALSACDDRHSTPTLPPVVQRAPAGPSDVIVMVSPTFRVPDVARAYGVQPTFVYEHVFRGFAGSVSAAARQGLQNDPRVEHVEDDRPVVTLEVQSDPPSWGLDRVDQRDLPLDGTYAYGLDGTGIRAYVVDTGIRYTHQEFSGRATFGFDAFDGDGSDCDGHGTHVAGTIGGVTTGIAKNVELVSVRVIGCAGAGTVSTMVAGLDWIIGNGTRPAVVNISLGVDGDNTLDHAVQSVIDAGYFVAVSAGNSSASACDQSPARVVDAMTASASTMNDVRATWASHGSCVDIFAPGAGIESASSIDDTSLESRSGTSMATPHVSGAAALLLQDQPGLSPASVKSTLYQRSTKNAIDDALTANNDLLYVPADGATDTNSPPSAGFTRSCNELTCSFTNQSSDVDGDPLTYLWDFGDGTTSTATNPSHTWSSDGTWTVRLTAEDPDGATDQVAKAVTVSAGAIELSVSGDRQKGEHTLFLSWSGADGSEVNVYRNGSLLLRTINDGRHTDATTNRGNGSYTYQVCEVTSDLCSNTATFEF